MYVLGIDVGTGGARVVACDAEGRALASAAHPFAQVALPERPEGWFEQSPSDWWAATANCLRQVAGQLRGQRIGAEAICGLSVTSTSGTVCLVDGRGEALGPALMYNDRRAVREAAEVNRAGAELAAKLGYRFSASFALPKLLWLQRRDSERFRAACYFLSPTDFIIGRLTGCFDVSDYSNALKVGYDLIEGRWPDFIEAELGIPCAKLPRIVPPGTQIGAITPSAAEETGLAEGTPVLAGMTDGCASQVSTGAVAPGQWNSTLGTTLVIKGVSRPLLRDPEGRIYCHRHPDGYWLPGGASNTGGECISKRFDAARLEALNAEALHLAPTDLVAYPLVGKGERFPFARPQAEGFVLGEAADEATLYTAYLEGVGYVERLAYETLAELGAEIGDEIYLAGGATESRAWVQIRADILQKTLLLPEVSGGAMGAAIVAAGGTLYAPAGVVAAAKAMVRIAGRFAPRRALGDAYDERYARFRAACRERGYIEG